MADGSRERTDQLEEVRNALISPVSLSSRRRIEDEAKVREPDMRVVGRSKQMGNILRSKR